MTLLNRNLILIPAAFALGLASGVYAFGEQTRQNEAVGTSPDAAQENSVGIPADLTDLRDLIEASERERRRLEDELFGLQERVAMLEQTLGSADRDAFARSAGEPSSMEAGASEDTGLNEAALVAAGIDAQLASSIVGRQAAVEMKRLELRDEAIRDEWFGTQRYFEALEDINAATSSLREEIGDQAYDRYLYAIGEDNRIFVTSVIPGSPAEQAGVRSGDVLLNYAGREVFSGGELQSETSAGQRGEPVTVRVRRNDSIIELLLPRGPMGVRLDSARLRPQG